MLEEGVTCRASVPQEDAELKIQAMPHDRYWKRGGNRRTAVSSMVEAFERGMSKGGLSSCKAAPVLQASLHCSLCCNYT